MADASQPPEPGGFFPSQTLPSPAPSSTSARPSALLPHPRARSLRPGSNKEETVRRYVEERLAMINRRYVKKHGNPEPGDQVVGYKTFAELCNDLHGVVDVLWLSGTPSIQIPFLLNIASDFTQWIDAFPSSPKATFSILKKLDHCFASILTGRDIETKDTLPGFENGMRAGMSTTDMVRCRSSVEQTRLVIVEVLSKKPDEDDEMEETESETDVTMDNNTENDDAVDPVWDGDDDGFYLDATRVYELTIVQLGERLGDVFGPAVPGASNNALCSAAP
ncbi:meiotic recombination protein DMC1 [Colletotrichum graminicola]|uniref:Meiotic recombination protein DMC1 n=1 Tax=Colletotrichum graminicola (strain M1.001 / M2 / FGSC 10212) TaxID=645133 RepID=E3QBS4_COLGM|nr:meiotic recombination protein DMC1 [Colletotrichum graminicola M1.001]EFQ28413.1 meiotic recombination protein DMC1 [Colletotrichum graminicola M1.001]WDK20790.1 meiotic recombination protein DMC1 [Colletotrichum graminicola]